MLRVSSLVQSPALLQEQDLFVCPNCQQLVANSHHSSHLRKCSHASAAPPIQSLFHVQGADPPVPMPTFDSVCKLTGRTVRHIPVKNRLEFALALCSTLRSALHDNSEDAWPVQTAVSLAREGLLSKACQVLTSSGLAPTIIPHGISWSRSIPKAPPPLGNSSHMAPLHSFPKDTACGPSGLRIQHLIEAAEVPLTVANL
ncbi:hypothetical protein EMCRGX_G009517 [Ephydatia muelleri]